MPQINITIPSVPVVEPTTSYSQDVAVEAGVGQNTKSVSFGAIQNNGNVDRTLQFTVTDVVGGTVSALGFKNAQGNMTWNVNQTTASIPIGAGKSNEVAVEFKFTPGQPGEPASACTATVTSQWV